MTETIIVKFDDRYAHEIKRIRNDVFKNEQNIDEELNFDGRDSGSSFRLHM